MGRIFTAPVPWTSRSGPSDRIAARGAGPRAGRAPRRMRSSPKRGTAGRAQRAGAEARELLRSGRLGALSPAETARPARARAPPGAPGAEGSVDPAPGKAPPAEPPDGHPAARTPTGRTRAAARSKAPPTPLDAPRSRPEGPPIHSVRPCHTLTHNRTRGVLGHPLDCLPSPSPISVESRFPPRPTSGRVGPFPERVRGSVPPLQSPGPSTSSGPDRRRGARPRTGRHDVGGPGPTACAGPPQYRGTSLRAIFARPWTTRGG